MAADNERKFLIFLVHGQRHAVDLAYVAEVMNPVRSWPIPLAPPCYIGAINFHGAIVAVLDPAFFLGLAVTTHTEKIIVLDPSVAALGFAVERVIRIVPAEEVEFKKTDTYLASASLSLPDGDATLLDIDAIVREAESAINEQAVKKT